MREVKIRFSIIDDFQQVLSLFIKGIDNDGNHCTIGEVEWRPYDPRSIFHMEPFQVFNRDYGQELIDNLWSLGYRPTAGRGSAGSFEAQGAHLRDLQAYFYKKEGINEP